MSTSIEHAVELAAESVDLAGAPMAQATSVVRVSPQLKREAKAAANAPGGAMLPGIDPQDFVRENRIHIKDGSLFVDPYLVLHPRELDPLNEAALRQKLQLTYSINNPGFFDSKKRSAVAVNLGQLVPISPSAKRSHLMEEVSKFNTQVEAGKDTELQNELDRKTSPFASIVKQVTEQPASDPAGLELLKNSLSIYMLVREKLTQNGYLSPLTDYVVRAGTADQIISDLSPKIGVSPVALRQAALTGGVDGVGQLLGLDAKYIADVKQLSEYAATQDFGHNVIEHWHLGRQLQGINAPLQEKLTVGMDARITAKIAEYRDRVRHHYDVPESIKQEQNRTADALNLLEPVQRALMFKLGYEVCYTPEVTADAIAFHQGVYGLHRKAASDLRDVRGTYRIYFSGHGDMKGSRRTFVHEAAHLLCPDQFAPEQVQQIDALARSDQQRFAKFQQLMDAHYTEFESLFNAYKAGNPQEKAAVVAATNERFGAYGMQAEALFPYLREARDFQFAVKHAYDTLSTEGDRYNRSNYNNPEERFREVISRFAELKQVEYKGEPQFLQFLAPGLNQIWETQYLPHLSRVLTGITNGTIPYVRAKQTPQKDEVDSVAAAASVEPKVRDDKKVEQRPGAAADAIVDGPLTTISAPSIELNSRTMPALGALNGMGASLQI